jgi:hypothetical protein
MNYLLKYTIYGRLVLAAFSLSAGCKKTDESKPEPTITINIQSPVEGMVVAQGDTLQIIASVSGPVEVHGYEWKIKDKSSGAELGKGESHSHGKELDINAVFVNTVSSTTAAELEISVEVDHDGTEANKKVNITLDR